MGIARPLNATVVHALRTHVESRHEMATYSELHRIGFGASLLARAVREGWLVRPQHGLYVARSVWDRAEYPSDRHKLIVGAMSRNHPNSIFCLRSAAAVHGIPLLGKPDQRAQILVDPVRGGRSTRHLYRHQGVPDPAARTIDGVRVTSPARTVVDISRIESFASGLTSMDHVLHNDLADMTTISRVIASMGKRQGVQRARTVARYADPLSESAGESLSRARMIELGYDPPQLQVWLTGDDGRQYRVDFFWESLGIAGEFDGFSKYGRTFNSSGEAPGNVVHREKRREEALNRAGYKVVRWNWDEALRPDRLDEILRGAGIPRTPA